MKIGIDLRICHEEGYYPQFIQELFTTLIQNNDDHEFVIFVHENHSFHNFSVSQKETRLQRGSFLDAFRVKQLFTTENLDLLVLPDHHSPLGYKGRTLTLLPNLKETFFPNLTWIQHKFYEYQFSESIKKSEKLIVLDTNTALELNERLNVIEGKIEHIHGFFPQMDVQENPSEVLQINVRAKHNLPGEYLIYDSGDETHNNFERILRAIQKVNASHSTPLSVIITCETTSRDLDLREKVIEYNMAENIIFLGELSEKEKKSYYEQSLGVIYSSIYESFPFHCTSALHYQSPMFINDIAGQKEIFGESAHYLDPLAVHNMSDTFLGVLKQGKKREDYTHIGEKYTPQKSVQELSSIIQNIKF